MYIAGFDKGVSWTPDSGGAASTINVLGWSQEDGGDTPEITHTGTKGQQAFLAGIARCPVSFDANLDNGATPQSIGLTFGAKGTLNFSKGVAAGADTIHVIIQKIATKSVVNGVVSFSVTAASDIIKSDGTVLTTSITVN